MDSPLSVGLEFEVKLAFEAEELYEANPEIKHMELVKDHQPVIGRRAALGRYHAKTYNNWGLRDNANPIYPEETSLQNYMQSTNICDFCMYKDEPLKLVQHQLQKAGIESSIFSDLTTKQKDYSIAPWSIQRDTSLQGLTPEQKLAAFHKTITSIEEARETDCYGLELVTWPLTSARSAFDNVTAASEALRTLKHGYILDGETGLHAHVGNVDGTPFSLSVLQNLFLIVVLFEDELSLLHSHKRRRGAGNGEIESNREEFYAEPAEEVTRLVPDPIHPGKTISATFYQNYKPVPEIERMIFEDITTAKDPQAQFRQLTGDKQHAVNFSYCFRDNTQDQAAATVEFRQHDGTFDGETASNWFQHCQSLVALAQRYAREGTTITQRLGIHSWNNAIRIEDLWEEMALPLKNRAFYRSRIENIMAEDPSWEPCPPIWEPVEEYDEFEGEGRDASDIALDRIPSPEDVVEFSISSAQAPAIVLCTSSLESNRP